ncbi:ATP-dependent Clp protease adaptor ClpS [Sanyastnella coralliicola]|uniref:ATP-dependent Clp protease adaptor ClpS n=1 Tax=Sanyastnella coralliicola TaxID=3069118 RepID=UPI0027B9C064|nr:ATP-dependent Clp protease adaptor ClpS [Longitalea sp. SCSIO 12813]
MERILISTSNPQEEEDVLVLTEEVDEKQIVLFNDEVNTFDFVIESLIKVCGHDPIQAEQCTIIVHFKGKCSVKKGTFEDLEPMCTALLDRGLTAEIQ